MNSTRFDVGSARRFFSDEAMWTSERAGWTSVHLRHYSHVREIEHCELPPSPDQVIVLVTSGATLIESFREGRWRSSAHRPGSLGFTAPGEAARLRWRGDQAHETLHLHLPAATMVEAIEELRDETGAGSGCPGHFAGGDPLIEALLPTLVRAADEGLGDLYAASAAQFLARHLLIQHRAPVVDQPDSGEWPRMRRVEDFMVAQMSEPITLDQLARVAGCGPFRLIRLCKTHWGQTPFERLTALRFREAVRLLRTSDASVLTIALNCGYSNPSHFATAFRRRTGMSPTDYRAEVVERSRSATERR